MFARNCPHTTSASDTSRTESYPSRQIRSPRSPSTWSECRSRCKPERVETRLAPSPDCHETPRGKKGAPKRAQIFRRNKKIDQQQRSVRTNNLRPLSASKARRLHRLPRDIRRRRNTLHPQFELVRIRGALESSLVIHQPRLEQIPERLVKRLHAILRRAGGNRFADGARFLRHQNAFPDIGS